MNEYFEIVDWYKNIPDVHERVNYFLTRLLYRQWGYMGSNKGEFSHVYFTWYEIRSLLGKNHREILLELCGDNGIVVVEKIPMNSMYGRRLHCYKFSMKMSIFTRKPIQSKRLFNSIKNTTMRLSDYPNEYHCAIKTLRNFRMRISLEEYESIVAENYSNYIDTKETPLSFDEYMFSYRSIYTNIQHFSRVRGRGMYNHVTIDEFGHRLHTPYTSLPSFLRKYITTIKGEHLESIDLKQSQPSFLNELLYSINPNNSFSKDFLSSDDIYHSIMEKVSLTSRKEAKKLFFKMVFGYPKGKHFNLFKQYYPDVADIIHSINSQVNPDNPSTKRHSNLAMMLQRYESSVFVKVWNKLTENGIRYITIHDEVMVEARHHSKAVRIIYDELSKHLVNPELVIDKV